MKSLLRVMVKVWKQTQSCHSIWNVVSQRISLELEVVALRVLYYAAISRFNLYPRPMNAVKTLNADFRTKTKNLTTNFHILKQLNLITNYRQLFMTMKANLKHDQTLFVKMTKNKNNVKRNSSNATVFLLVQEYCRLAKLLEPSERDIESISAILELAQYDSELNCLINEADHLIAYELGLSEEVEEDHTNFRVSEEENKKSCCELTSISNFINRNYPVVFNYNSSNY